MKNSNEWMPSKYVYNNKGKLTASRNPKEVGQSSILITDIISSFYEKYLPLYAKGKLIDLGCGKAPLYCEYKKYVDDVICVDWENTHHKNQYLDYECDLTKTLPFNNNEFDTIILSDVLEHIPEPQNLWNELYRILSVDGIVLLNVPFFYWIHEAPHDYYRYTEFALRRFAEASGFTLLVLHPTGGTPEILADLLAKHFRHIPVIGNTLAITVQFMIIKLINTSLGNKISAKTAINFPLGYFCVAQKTARESL